MDVIELSKSNLKTILLKKESLELLLASRKTINITPFIIGYPDIYNAFLSFDFKLLKAVTTHYIDLENAFEGELTLEEKAAKACSKFLLEEKLYEKGRRELKVINRYLKDIEYAEVQAN